VTEPYRKKLIEVALPLAAINAESAREKSIRHGHPSTLHLWWARRPLAACRAVLFSSLVDDPDSDPQYRKPDGSVDEEAAGIKRADLFNLIEELVMWENSNNSDVIRSARAEIARCVASRLIETGKLKKDADIGSGVTAGEIVKRGHCKPIPMGLDSKAGRVRFSFEMNRLPPAEVVNKFLAEHAPPVLDPFAGGGSIPLEAQRLGLRAYASDLNPVPVLINKALIEIPPKFAGKPPVNPEARGEAAPSKGKSKKGKSLVEKEWPGATGLAEDVRYYGQWMRDEAEKRVGHLYPKVEVTAEMAKDRPDLLPYVGQQLTVIAWLWARTVASPNPAANGAHVPLVRSFWLATKPGKKTWIEPVIDSANNRYSFTVRCGEDLKGFDPSEGTIGRRGGRCLITGAPMPLNHVRAEGKAGRMASRLMAIVCLGNRCRVYLPPIASHEVAARQATPDWRPEGELPLKHRNFQPPVYGMTKIGDLFTDRQLVFLNRLAELIGLVHSQITNDAGGRADAVAYANAVCTYLALAASKSADGNSTVCSWMPGLKYEVVRTTFSRQALPMTWDYAESNPFAGSSGDFQEQVNRITTVFGIGLPPSVVQAGVVRQLDAAAPQHEFKACVSTDPPYYDNIAYADLSDFFYVWLRRSISRLYPDLFSTVLVPKGPEIVAFAHRFDGDRQKARDFFEQSLGQAFARARQVQEPFSPMTVYYAFKQTESDDDTDDGDDDTDSDSHASTGWETMLDGLIKAGCSILGTWPMRSERSARSVAIGANALASSIVLVCRPRPENAALATRKEFITALRRELPDALRNLQRGNIAPVDLAQAAIGPGMATFTRYSKVVESDGSSMTVRTALGLINQSLDEVLAEQEGEFDVDTRWALSWFEQFGMEEGPFGDAETLSKAKNTAINGLQEAGVIVAKAGKVRLVKRDELPENWNPATDKRLTVWEVTQHLIRRLDQQGETGAAELIGQLGGIAEVARDLAYRLYSTCERKKWAQEALAYNSLVVAWPELTKLARSTRIRQTSTQQELFN
jgi:putative DNA methylase